MCVCVCVCICVYMCVCVCVCMLGEGAALLDGSCRVLRVDLFKVIDRIVLGQ